MIAEERLTPNGPDPILALRLRPWRELGVLGVMLMGLSWGIPWFRSLTQATNDLSVTYAFLVYGGMMAAAYLFVRLLNALRLRAEIRRGVLLVVLVVSIFVGLKMLLFAEEDVSLADLTDRQLSSFSDAFALIPDEFIITVGVLVAWRRGTQLANEKIGPRLIRSAFGIGLGMFFAFIFLNTLVTGETLGSMPTLFLFSALMAMGAARVSVISSLRGGRDNPFDRRWMTGMLFSVAGAVGIAAWLGAEMSGGEGVLGIVPRFILGIGLAVSFLILLPIFMLMYWLLYTTVTVMEADNPLVDRIGDVIGRLQGAAEGLFDFLEPYLGPLGGFLAQFGIVTKTLILWGVVLFLVLVILFMTYIQDSRRRARLREEYERIAEEGLLNSLRKALLGGAQKAGEGLADLFDMDRRRRRMAAARIRRIYQQLMALCEELDHARPEASTPFEFISSLCEIFPAQRAEVEQITQAYQQVRYGELPESGEEVAAVEAAWVRVREQGDALLKAGPRKAK